MIGAIKEPLELRMLETTLASVDETGCRVMEYIAGETYMVYPAIAKYFLREKKAIKIEKVKPNIDKVATPKSKKVVVPKSKKRTYKKKV